MPKPCPLVTIAAAALALVVLITTQASTARGVHCATARARLHAFDAVVVVHGAAARGVVDAPAALDSQRGQGASTDDHGARACPPPVVAVPPARTREPLALERAGDASPRPPPPASRAALLQLERPPRRA